MLRNVGKHSRWGSITSGLLATLLTAGYYGPVQAGTPRALSVFTEPAGAAVYVDGQLKGSAPLSLAELPAGDHRVTVTKEGYLENSRVVSLRLGKPQTVQVKLTPDTGQARRSVQVEEGTKTGGGGGSKKVLWIGLGAVAVGAGVFLALPKNKAPVAGTVTASPSTGLMAVTTITFGSSATDPDGDPLTYTWNFGDGGTGSGSSTTHVYNQAGTFNVSVTVNDGKKSATASGSVTIKSLSGTWAGNLDDRTTTFFTWNLTQNGTSISGTYSDTVNGTGSVSGSVSAPNNVSLRSSIPGFRVGIWTGTVESSVDRINGTVDWFVGGVRSFYLNRR